MKFERACKENGDHTRDETVPLLVHRCLYNLSPIYILITYVFILIRLLIHAHVSHLIITPPITPLSLYHPPLITPLPPIIIVLHVFFHKHISYKHSRGSFCEKNKHNA